MSIRREDIDAGRVALAGVATGARIGPVSPGEVLREEFLIPLGLSATRLAREIGVPTNRITGIVNETRAVSAATAILLGERFGTTPRFWMGLQASFDLEKASKEASENGRRAAARPRRDINLAKDAAARIAAKVLSGRPASSAEQKALARSVLSAQTVRKGQRP
jgi:addiction module HigA family antidote